MKKLWCLLLSVLLTLGCAVFSACDRTPSGDDPGGVVQPGDPDPGDPDPGDPDPDDPDPDDPDPDDPDPGDPNPDAPDPDKPHEHSFGEWTVTVPASCMEIGQEQRVCACGEVEIRWLWALGHDYVDGVCTRCKETVEAAGAAGLLYTAMGEGVCAVRWDGQTELPAEVTIPQEYRGMRVAIIAPYGFAGCAELERIVIPSGVETIEMGAFFGCKNLVRADLPDGLTQIGAGAFAGCESLESAAIPRGVAQIAANTWDGCTRLSSVTFSAGLQEIGYRAFADCTALEGVDFPDGLAQIGQDAFAGCAALTGVELPDGLVGLGKDAFSTSSRGKTAWNIWTAGSSAAIGTSAPSLSARTLPASPTVPLPAARVWRRSRSPRA